MEFTETQLKLLDEGHLAVLATIGPTGAPHSAPMWYLRLDNSLLMLTGRTSQKARNLERDPRASITIDDRNRPYRALMLECTAVPADLDIQEVRPRIARRYLSEDEAMAYVESRRGADSVAFVFTPSRISQYPS